MPTLVLNYKGFSLPVEFRKRGYFFKTEFEPGKTIYQILFERLIDGKVVSIGGLVREYGGRNQGLSRTGWENAIKRLEAAKARSSNLPLREKAFKRPLRGGNSAVVSRKSGLSRFTPKQKKVILQTIKVAYKNNARPSNKLLREKCLAVLKRRGLSENVILGPSSLNIYKKELGIPPMPPKERPGFSPLQKKVIQQTIKAVYKDIKEPRPHELRSACWQALKRKDLLGDIKLDLSTIRRYKKKLGFPPIPRGRVPRRR